MRIYIDTSVIGGYFDKDFKEWSRKLFKEFISKKKIAVISDLTLAELEYAPKRVKKLIELLPKDSTEEILLNDEAKVLSNNYIREKTVTEKYLMDTRHIALATIHKVDVLVSWNFKHIVNLYKIRLYNSVNLKYGYSMIDIRTPREIIDEY